MGVPEKTIDVPRLRKIIAEVVKESPGRRIATLKEAVRRYNVGRAEGAEVHWGTIYRRAGSLGIVMPRAAKVGARPASEYREAVKVARRALEACAVEHGWRAKHPLWETLNGLRVAMGLPAVAPVNRPTSDHFRIATVRRRPGRAGETNGKAC